MTFYSRQSDCARRARKNKNAGTINFTSQIASSICTVAFTKHEKSDATIFTSRCSRTAVSYRFRGGQALPLSFVRFLRLANGSSKNRRSPARRSRNGRESSSERTGEMPRPSLAHWPGNCQAVANAMPPDGRAATCKTTRKLACNGHATSDATSRETSRKMTARNSVITILNLSSKNYEHITIITQP